MSSTIRSRKRALKHEELAVPQKKQEPGIAQAVARSPLSHAAVGLASMMLATGGAAAQDAGGALPTIDVLGDTGGSYQSTEQTITRLPTALKDTPQTINVVPEKVIQDQALVSMEDALRTVPGITFSAGEGGQQGDSPIIRGFAARGDIFRDGIRDPGWYTRDLFNADRVEVYKGPSAFAFGRGSTGGAINTVSKLPTGASFIDGIISGTSEAGYRAVIDASGKKDNISGRIAAMYQDVPTPDRDNVYTKRWGVAPSVKVDMGLQTRAIFSYIYQGEESIPDYGIPYLPAPTYRATNGTLNNPGYYGNGQPTPPVPVPRSNWFGVVGGPLADLVKTETHILTAKLEHDIAPDLKITNATRYISSNRFARVTSPRSLGNATSDLVVPEPSSGPAIAAPPPGYPVNLMTIGREHFQIETDNTMLINQTDLTGKFDTGGLQHTFAVGVEASRETRDQVRAIGMNGGRTLCDPVDIRCRTNVFSPLDTSFGGEFNGWGPPNSSVSTNFAIYAFDQVKLNEFFELLGSVRYDRLKTDYEDLAASAATRNLSRTDGMFSWRVGGVFHPTTNTSIYAAHGTSFNPTAEFGTLSAQPTGPTQILDPEKNVTTEVGAKADVLGGRLSLTGAVFRIEKTNLRIPLDPTNTGRNAAQQLGGLARVDGFELGAAGKLTDQWSVFAGYSYLDSKIVETNNLAELGRELPNTPKHNFTLWTTYDVTPDWTVGGGVTYASDAWVNTTNTSYVPDYWKVDLMTSYKVTKNSTLQLNIYNLTDAKYFAQYYGGHAVPASGRWAMLSYRVHFTPEDAPKPIKPVGYFK
jgi:catecholate siderophore receptor